jgi:acyl-CoA dehydrogenase
LPDQTIFPIFAELDKGSAHPDGWRLWVGNWSAVKAVGRGNVDFDFSDEQKELRDHARRFFEKSSPRKTVRAVLDGEQGLVASLWRAMTDMGFAGTAIPEAYGGLGLGYLELCTIAEELGRSLAPVPFSSSIYLAAEFILAAGSEEQKQAWLPRLASGDAIGTLALAEGLGTVTPDTIAAAVVDGGLNGIKLPVSDGMIADFAIVAARDGTRDGASVSLFIADLTGAGVDRAPVFTIDPTRGHARLTFSNVVAEPLGSDEDGWPIIDRVFDRAAVLFAFEQIGGADRALEMARDYALERRAFGRQIGSFQGLKHMLADMYVSATLARSNAYYAAWALSTDSADLPQAAATARVSATQAFQHCARNNMQVHGGMGFTWEFDCHLYYRRSNLLALALGGQSRWENLLIERLRTPVAP